jgi:DNA-binding transcriptional MerR regulator
LFSPSERSDSGHRLYNEADIKRLQQILSLKDLGISLEEIQTVLRGNLYTPYDIVSIQIERIKKNIKTQQKLLSELERVAERMNQHESLSVESFTTLLEMMKGNHEKYIIEHRLNWENRFDQLGEMLNRNSL